MPASMHRRRSSAAMWPVIAMMVLLRPRAPVLSSLRISAVATKPFITGISQSYIIRQRPCSSASQHSSDRATARRPSSYHKDQVVLLGAYGLDSL